jgi:DNA-binding MarR family transcriptional regulator
MLKTHKLQGIVKGFANHRRIQILELLEKYPEISLSDVSSRLKINLKTASEHIGRLSRSGLIFKRYRARNVIHKLSPLGRHILTFLRKLE